MDNSFYRKVLQELSGELHLHLPLNGEITEEHPTDWDLLPSSIIGTARKQELSLSL